MTVSKDSPKHSSNHSSYSPKSNHSSKHKTSSKHSPKNSPRQRIYTDLQLDLANEKLNWDSSMQEIVMYTYHDWQLFLDATTKYRQRVSGNNNYKKLFKGFHNWFKWKKVGLLSPSQGWQKYIQTKKFLDDESVLTLIDTKSQYQQIELISSDSDESDTNEEINTAYMKTTLLNDDSQSEGSLDDSHNIFFSEHEELEQLHQIIETTNREMNSAQILLKLQQSLYPFDSQTDGSHLIDHQEVERLRQDIELCEEVIDDHRKERRLFMLELEKMKTQFEIEKEQLHAELRELKSFVLGKRKRDEYHDSESFVPA